MWETDEPLKRQDRESSGSESLVLLSLIQHVLTAIETMNNGQATRTNMWRNIWRKAPLQARKPEEPPCCSVPTCGCIDQALLGGHGGQHSLIWGQLRSGGKEAGAGVIRFSSKIV